MLRRFIRWVWGIDEIVPEPLPDDPWKRMFELIDRHKGLLYGEFTIHHLDLTPGFYSDSIDQLFERLELLIVHIQDDEAETPAWKDRRRETIPIPAPDYLYSNKHGYRPLENAVGLVSEKIAIIHNLFESKELNEQHVHYPYLRREFASVVKDTCTFLEFALTLAIPK